MYELLVALFALPLLAALTISLVPRRPSLVRGLSLAASAATALCATVLLPLAGDGPAIHLEWLPGTGPIAIGLGTTGLYAVLVTTWAAFFALLATSWGAEATPPLALAAVFLALGAGNVAFLTEQFLARYVALELVALAVALAPLIELRGRDGSRAFWLVYLMLRVGDAGLLTAILILFDASGTLQIAPALQGAATLGTARLGWTLFGLLLAVWVKLGNWPFHIWTRYGRALALNTQAWLYAIVMPNLGAYLLYRVAPLLALSGTIQTLILWLGAGAALLTVLLALTRTSLRSALVYVGATRGGWLAFAAVSGVGAAVWLALLATTPLYLLLFLAGTMRERGARSVPGRTAQVLFGVAGLGLATVGLAITYWARQTGVPLDALFVAEISVALLAVWIVREGTRRRVDPVSGPAEAEAGPGSSPARWVATGALGMAALAGVFTLGPLVEHLVVTAGIPPPDPPTLATLVRYIASAPALLLTLALVLVAWWLRRRSGIRVLVPAPASGDQQMDVGYDVEDALVQAARALHAVVEIGFLEQLVLAVVQSVVDGALLTHRLVEHGGLEGLMQRVVEGVLGLGRATKRMHTGVLRHNLMWIPLSLALALMVALVYW